MENTRLKNMNSDDIYLALKEDILNLRLLPGQMISENEISKQYNVSRTPVKAAFLKLSCEKFIEIVPQKGTYVTLLDMELIKEIIYMRSVLECKVIREIGNEIPEIIIDKMADNLAKQEVIIKSERVNPEEFYRLDSEFHSISFEFLGKQKLWQIIQDFQVYYTRFRMLDIVAVGRFDELYKEHYEMFTIMKNGEFEKLEEFMNRHLNGNIKRLGNRIYTDLKDYFI